MKLAVSLLVLLAGGYNFSRPQLYDPASGAWSVGASIGGPERIDPLVVQLYDGQVLVAGGLVGSSYTTLAQVYGPGLNSWSDVAPAPTGRGYASAVALFDGRVLVTAGFNGTAVLGTTEI